MTWPVPVPLMTSPPAPLTGALTVRFALELFVHAWVASRETPPAPVARMLLAAEPDAWVMPPAFKVSVFAPTSMLAEFALLLPDPNLSALIEKLWPSVVLRLA